MDSKEVKAALKGAREAIRNKDFKEALRQCKTVLASDKNNYNALVFIGVAAEGLEQADQAQKAYKKAIEASPEQLLAWQGLCGFYEKTPSPEGDADLVNVYKKLISLNESDKTKVQELNKKLAKLYGKIGNLPEAIELHQVILREEGQGEERTDVILSLILLLQGQKSLSLQHQTLMLEICKEAITTELSAENSEIIVKQYLSLLLKQDNRSQMVSECDSLSSKYPANVAVLETRILLLMEDLIEAEQPTPLLVKLREASKTLASMSADNPYLSMCNGVLLMSERKYTEARSLLQQGVGSLSVVVCGYVHLARCQQMLHTNAACTDTCQIGLQCLEKKGRLLTVPAKSVGRQLQLILADCLYRIGSPQSLTQAMDILTQMCDECIQCRALLVLTCMKQGNIEEAEKYLGHLPGTGEKREELEARLALHKGNNTEALARLEKLCASHPEESEYLYLLGRALWQAKDGEPVEGAQERCFKSFLKAAKLDPYNSEIFLYLGHFYSQIQNDMVKAKRCYQKSFNLDPDNEEAGAALCDMLVAVREDEEAKQLLVTATSQARAGSVKWAWLRLGLHQVTHDDPTVAVTSFQAALRADPKDHHVWECLAEAYLQRGSYTAALKTFTKASELNPDSVYSLFQIASIKHTLGEYAEAVTEYKTILQKSANYVPALKGVGETLLQQARQHLDTYLDGLATDCCQQALAYLTRAASQRADLSCLWKLMGDACTILHALPSGTFSMQVPAKLVQQDKSSQEVISLGKMDVLKIGARCYGRAIKGIPESASLWHDLGVNYFHQSVESAEKDLSQKAEQSIKKAIGLDSNNFRHWNALGVIACSKLCDKAGLAQHCFIKSVEVESNNVVAWTNLGSLYLQHDNVQLAHEAFKVAQSLDPTYVACWIGQALIAEVVGHDDAMDLFRHTTELGIHLEGSVGYGSWVCSMLQDHHKRSTSMFQYAIKQMAAIPAASDALARYTARVKDDATAYNLYGLLLEHQDLYNSATHAFNSALDLLEKDDSQAESLVKVRINLGRVLCKGGNYAGAVEQYEKAGVVDKVEDLCFLAQAHYKLGQFQDSFKVYNQALSVAELDEDKSHIYSALGMVAYKFGDVEGAKTAFFQGSQTTAPSAIGLEALCSLGLLQSDATLATAALQELLKLGNKDPSLPDTTWLTAALHVMQGNGEAARRSIQREIVKNPSCPRLWSVLSSILLLSCPERGGAAATCALASQLLCLHGDKSIPMLLTQGQLSGGHHSKRNANRSALSAAQRAMHLYPDRVSTKCGLIAAIHAEAKLSDSSTQKSYLEVEQHYIEAVEGSGDTLPPGVALWLWRQKLVGLVGCSRAEAARAVLKQVPNDPDCKQFASVIEALLSGDIAAVQGLVSQASSHLYSSQVLIEMLIKQGLVGEADTAIRQALQLAQADSRQQVQLETLLRLASLAYHQIVTGSGDKATMKSVFDEAASEILNINPGCSAVLLMMGALSMKNPKTSKHFQNALEAGSRRPGRGHDVSLARQAVVKNLLYNQKDLELAQKLFEDAKEDGDECTVKLYTDLKGED